MNIRETEFWKQLEPLFFGSAPVDPPDADIFRSPKYCNHAIFWDRLQLAINRAERSKSHVLLLLMQLRGASVAVAGVDGRGIELAISRLGSCLRSSDAVCSLGDGRVAVLLEDIQESTLIPLIVEKIHSTLRTPPKSAGQRMRLQPYSGASLYPFDGDNCDQLWQQAFVALEYALGDEPGTFCFAPKTTGHGAMERFDLIKDMYKGFRNSDFQVVYQPVYDVDGLRLKAVEALLRWQHPERGYLYPHLFLELLEESGLIVPIGERVLREACQFGRALIDNGQEPVRICVNISQRQLADSGFLLSVLDALYDAELEPGLLQLEFSEQVLSRRPELAQRILPEIRSAGIAVAVDHFGVGESLLTDLVRLPLTLIKLDRTLVGGLTEDSISQAITSGALALAKSAGIHVGAVGIEDNTQMDILDSMGCEEVQGVFLSQPFPAQDLLPRLAI